MNKLTFRNGDKIDAIGLGTWKSEPGEVGQAVREAIKIGYRHIDCAWIYQNEAEIGQAFQEAFTAGEVKREELFVTSKLWNSFHAADDVEIAVKETLAALKLDYLDLYLIHWPIAHKPGVTFSEDASGFAPVLKTTLSLIPGKPWKLWWRKGWSKHIGVSNFNVPKLQKLMETAEDCLLK